MSDNELKLEEKLKKLREEVSGSGRTRSKFAEYLGVNQARYGEWESGKVRPQLETLERIAEKCGIDVSYFFEEEKPKTILTAAQKTLILECHALIQEILRFERFILNDPKEAEVSARDFFQELSKLRKELPGSEEETLSILNHEGLKNSPNSHH